MQGICGRDLTLIEKGGGILGGWLGTIAIKIYVLLNGQTRYNCICLLFDNCSNIIYLYFEF